MHPPETGTSSFDIAAREAHVLGTEPRVTALPDKDVEQELWDLVNEVRAGAGAPPAIESLPEYMRIVAKHPELFRRQMEMGATLYNGRIPPREREIAVLRCAWLTRSPYEWGEHVNIGQRCGLSAEDVARAMEGSSAPGWDDFDRAIVRGVEELLAEATLSDTTWDTLATRWDEAQMIEFPAMVGQYVSIAYLQNTLRVPLSDNNPGLSHR